MTTTPTATRDMEDVAARVRAYLDGLLYGDPVVHLINQLQAKSPEEVVGTGREPTDCPLHNVLVGCGLLVPEDEIDSKILYLYISPDEDVLALGLSERVELLIQAIDEEFRDGVDITAQGCLAIAEKFLAETPLDADHYPPS